MSSPDNITEEWNPQTVLRSLPEHLVHDEIFPKAVEIMTRADLEAVTSSRPWLFSGFFPGSKYLYRKTVPSLRLLGAMWRHFHARLPERLRDGLPATPDEAFDDKTFQPELSSFLFETETKHTLIMFNENQGLDPGSIYLEVMSPDADDGTDLVSARLFHFDFDFRVMNRQQGIDWPFQGPLETLFEFHERLNLPLSDYFDRQYLRIWALVAVMYAYFELFSRFPGNFTRTDFVGLYYQIKALRILFDADRVRPLDLRILNAHERVAGDWASVDDLGPLPTHPFDPTAIGELQPRQRRVLR